MGQIASKFLISTEMNIFVAFYEPNAAGKTVNKLSKAIPVRGRGGL
jgi:hypothetical protein